jgi:hypothetical protein
MAVGDDGGGDAREKNEEEKDLELDLMAQQELLRLTRQFRASSTVYNCVIITLFNQDTCGAHCSVRLNMQYD